MRRFKIGRSETCEIVIADASVSRQHADLVERGGGLFAVKDLGSTYGTHVWKGQSWVPAVAETEIRADTVIRFGEFQTTLHDVLSETQRAALGIAAGTAPAPAAVPATPVAVAPPSPRTVSPPLPATPPTPPAAAIVPTPVPPTPAAPVSAAPPEPPRPAPVPAAPPPDAVPPAPSRAEARPAAPRAEAPRKASRPRSAAVGARRRSLMMGLLGLGVFVGIAAVAVAAVVLLGDSNPPPRPDITTQSDTAAAQARMLEACTKQWESQVEDRRCRCFLSAAGPHLIAEDYDDFAEMIEAYVSGDTDRQESALQRAAEKRGAPANSRLTAAFKGAVRDCQQ